MNNLIYDYNLRCKTRFLNTTMYIWRAAEKSGLPLLDLGECNWYIRLRSTGKLGLGGRLVNFTLCTFGGEGGNWYKICTFEGNRYAHWYIHFQINLIGIPVEPKSTNTWRVVRRI